MKQLGKVALLMPILLVFIIGALVITVYDEHVDNNHPLYYLGVLSFAFIALQWIFYIANVLRSTTIPTKSQRLL